MTPAVRTIGFLRPSFFAASFMHQYTKAQHHALPGGQSAHWRYLSTCGPRLELRGTSRTCLDS